MTTPLMWKAAELNQRIYAHLLYRHVLSFNPEEKRWQIERNHLKLIPFYFCTFGIMFGLAFNICIFQIFKSILTSGESMNILVSCFIFGFAVTAAMCWSVSLALMILGVELIETYFNTLLDFEADVCGEKLKVYVNCDSLFCILTKGKKNPRIP